MNILANHQIYEFAGFRLDARLRLLTSAKSGEAIQLTPRVFDTLLYLVEHRDTLMKKEELIQAIWPDVVVEENNLNKNISTLRRVLGESAGKTRCIVTAPGHGYRFVAEVRVVPPTGTSRNGESVGEGPAAPEALGRPDQTTGSPSIRRKKTLAMILMVIFIITAGLWLGWKNPEVFSARTDTKVAVLPPDVLGDDTTLPHFAEGLAAELISVLSNKQVLAISREKTIELRGPWRAQSLAQLGASLLLDGTVEHDGDKLLVRIHLDDVRESVTVWSGEFKRNDNESTALQTQVASRVVDIVRFALDARSSKKVSIDAATLAAFLRAVDLTLEQNSLANRDLWLRARNELHTAIARAPDFARGHAALAEVDVSLANGSAPDERLFLAAEGKQEAERALALDPHSGNAYIALAFMEGTFHDLVRRERLLIKGIQADPDNWRLYGVQVNTMYLVGRIHDAYSYVNQAIGLNPTGPAPYATRVMLLADLSRIDEARAELAKLVRSWPHELMVRNLQCWIPMFHELPGQGFNEIDKCASSNPSIPGVEYWKVFLNARQSGDPAVVDAAAQYIKKTAGAGGFWRVSAIETLASLGRVDEAIKQAQLVPKADMTDASRFPMWLWFNSPAIAMSRDPRYIELAERRGVVEYWLTTDRWPDFCSEPDLPYDCRAEAKRVHKEER